MGARRANAACSVATGQRRRKWRMSVRSLLKKAMVSDSAIGVATTTCRVRLFPFGWAPTVCAGRVGCSETSPAYRWWSRRALRTSRAEFYLRTTHLELKAGPVDRPAPLCLVMLRSNEADAERYFSRRLRRSATKPNAAMPAPIRATDDGSGTRVVGCCQFSLPANAGDAEMARMLTAVKSLRICSSTCSGCLKIMPGRYVAALQPSPQVSHSGPQGAELEHYRFISGFASK